MSYVDVVADCGAVKGGMVDNTSAFQRAIDTAKSLGRKVYVPVGEFLVIGPLFGLEDVVIEGVASNKQYWLSGQNDTFARNVSVIKGNGTSVLFGWIAAESRALVRDICFTGYKKIIEKCSPRYFGFLNCAFKNMVVLEAKANETGAYHNFKFINCDFTNYGIIVTFIGRIIDSMWSGCTFVSAAAFDLHQAKANFILHNRLEWIDRGYAISLTGCEVNLIAHNFFDRVAGSGVQLREDNKHNLITANQFNRCGSLLRSDGSLASGLTEAHRAHIRIMEEQTNTAVHNNIFSRGYSGDHSGEMTPKYIISKLRTNPGLNPGMVPCEFSFKGNTINNGCAERFIYVEDGNYDMVQIDMESTYGEVNVFVADIARVIKGRVTAYNSEVACACVDEIPERMTVINHGGELMITGKQYGMVYGGKVNGKHRYTKDKVVYENAGHTTVLGDGINRKISYSMPNARKSLAGCPITVTVLYKTKGSVERSVEVTDGTTVLAQLPSLEQTNDARFLYKQRFVLPEDYAGAPLRLNLGVTKDTALTTGDYVKVDAVNISYGETISDTIIDRLNEFSA
ncbi:glycosyl hydrolase family 28-related protein (plasmid) [Paenibacillus sp. S-38]|uniref:glycosyl hydrolase family 28-related protein n=1 Tax=Paenibacillus sp. S-38 TaxID=3416710 RepID=UPI003CED5817